MKDFALGHRDMELVQSDVLVVRFTWIMMESSVDAVEFRCVTKEKPNEHNLS